MIAFLRLGSFEKYGSTLLLMACLALLSYVLTFPLQDYDTFWHLAYGRAMVASQTIINHEIFSYTAYGKDLESHSQFAQVILYALWVAGGAHALLAFKLAIAGAAFLLVVKTSRLFGADLAEGAVLALAVFVMGMSRIVERPELFSIILQALLIWLLFRARKVDYPHLWLWSIPPIMVVWDYLHGAMYGLIVLSTFVGAEVFRQIVLPKFGISRFALETTSRAAVNRLLGWSLATIVFMSAHPNGLLNYLNTMRVLPAESKFRMYGEFTPPDFVQFYPYWLFLACVVILVLLCVRQIDLTALVMILPFLYLSLNFNRAVLAFGIAAVPATAQALHHACIRIRSYRFGTSMLAVLLFLLLVTVIVYKRFYVIDSFRFGTGISSRVFPVGAARFIKAHNLNGNMYNMDGFGGYLAFFLGPERKIFHYNQPVVFTALYDFVHKPASRQQWHINYAIAGKPEELGMFENNGYKPVYWEPTSVLYLKETTENGPVLDRFAVEYFRPLLPDRDLLALGKHPKSAHKVLQETSTYLAYRQDARIADLFAKMLREAEFLHESQKLGLLADTLQHNEQSAALLALAGELSFKVGDMDGARSYFVKVLELDPGNFAAGIGLGYVLYEQGQFASAVRRFDLLVGNHPQAADAHYALGLAAMRLCDRETAGRGFEAYLKLAPDTKYSSRVKGYLENPDAFCKP